MLKNCLQLPLILSILSCGLACQAIAQSTPVKLQATPGITQFYQLYMNSVGKAAHIYTGSAYTARYSNAKGSPFFNASNFENADLSLSGVVYYQVPIKYDLVTQQVVINGPAGEAISLPEQKIDSFYLNGHIFERLQADSAGNGQFPEAFYDRLYAGRHVNLYVQRSRVVHQSLRAEDPAVFDVYDSYFIYKDGRYFLINSQRALQRMLGLSSQKLKFDEAHNRLSWKKDPEKVLRTAVGIFDMSTK